MSGSNREGTGFKNRSGSLRATNAEKLKPSGAKYKAIFDSVNDAILIHDADTGAILEVNRKVAELFGYTGAEARALTVEDISSGEHPYTQEGALDKIREAARNGGQLFEWRCKDRSGRLFWVEVNLKSTVIDGMPRIIAIARDITGRKNAEDALRESEEKFRSIYETSIDGILLTSPDGGIHAANPAACRITGMTEEEIVQAGRKGVSVESDPLMKAVLDERARTGYARGVVIHKRKDGTTYPIEISTSLMKDRNGDTTASVIIRDITERMQAEEELSRHRENLEALVQERTLELEIKNEMLEQEIAGKEQAEADKRKVESQLAQAQRIEAIDRFAGGIAHDLNNILYPIIMNIEELLAEEQPDSVHHEILTQTLKAAQRQRELVKKILSFSRRSEQVRQPVQVRPLLEETISFLKSSLPSTIEIRQSIDVKADTVLGDPVQVQQVIMNLCQNAADAYPTGKGIIEIGLTDTHMKSLNSHAGIDTRDYLKLTVKDSGMGMSLGVMDRIFEPFFTSKGVGKGTGMGLSVVYGIVKSHGGTITVESEEGKGSLFTVYCPVYEEHVQEKASPPEITLSDQGRGKILLVDDEELILSSLQRALKASGYHITACRDGQEALEVFAEKPLDFDMVITDLTMPGMTGLDLSRKIQGIRPYIPIVLCTGFNDVISREDARSFGIKELLLKPVGPGELKKVIHRALER